MAIISEKYLISWKNINELGDLERLQLALKYMPDEKLMYKLRDQRYKGRNDYPIRATWNSILAGIVFEHKSIESLIRELKRNAQLREICGFNPFKGANAVPSKSAYSRFLANLMKNQHLIDEMFDNLVKKLSHLLPDFGKKIAFDGKALNSLACRRNEKDNTDRRRDNDANWGCKEYSGKNKDGSIWKKIKSWFGYKLHLIVDAVYELPIAFEVTKASKGEQPVMRRMFDRLDDNHPNLVEQCDYAMGDRGYDSTDMVIQLWDKYKIKPIIDIRNMWKDGEETHLLKSKQIENVTYNFRGTVFCHCPITGEIKEMSYGGFEEDRSTLKYHCPARHYGCECKGMKQCPIKKSIRIPLYENRRIFTPVARSSYKWKMLYNKRSSVERVNSRLDVSFGFEHHYIRGLSKMKIRCGLALCVMLAMAVGRIEQDQRHLMRSLVKAA